MKRRLSNLLFVACYLFFATGSFAQENRLVEIEKRLEALSESTVPGLNEKVDISVSDVQIQEFVRGLANNNKVNISIDPKLNIMIVNNFANEPLKNVLVFLCKEYDLTIDFTGSILSISKYEAPVEVVTPKPKKALNIQFDASKQLISWDLNRDSLRSVAKKITQLTGKNILLSPGLENYFVMSYIQKLPLEEALKNLSFSNKLKTNISDNGSFFIEKSEDISKVSGTGRTRTNNRTKGQQSTSGEVAIKINDHGSGIFSIDIDAIDYPIAEIIKNVSEQLDIDYFMFSDPKGTTTTKVKGISYEDMLAFLLRGTAHTYKQEGKIYLIGERKFEGLRSSKVIQLQYRNLDQMLEIIPAELKKGIEIKEFSELNSIVLSGSTPQIREVATFIEELDKTVPMIMIEVILLDVRKGKSIKTGIRAGLGGDSVTTGGTIFPGIDFNFSSKSINSFLNALSAGSAVNLGQVTPNFYVGLSAIDNTDNANVRSMPKLSTLNGHNANLTIGSTRYYSIQTQSLVGTQNPVVNTTQQFNAVQANLSINITPSVSGDEQVTLDIQVEISDFIGDPPANAPPPSATSSFQSLVRVRNGDMVVLGGIERVEKSESSTGVPILSRIPILKWLFSSRSKSKSKTISTVFIKPTIIY